MQSVIENLGKVAPTFEGAYNSNLAYDRLSCVFDASTGSTYISRRPVPMGVKIYDIKYWQPLSIGTNRIPLTESLGDDSFRAVTQKFITELWNKQYEFNATVEGAVALSEEAIKAIELLSKDQQEALKLAVEVVRCTNRLNQLEEDLNGYSFREMNEDEYEDASNNKELNDDTIYFVFENENTGEEEDDYA